jgi:hypothetical protein
MLSLCVCSWANVFITTPPGMTWMARSDTCSSLGLSARLDSLELWDTWYRPWNRVIGGMWLKRCVPSWSLAATSTRTAFDAQGWPLRILLCLAPRLHRLQSLHRPRLTDLIKIALNLTRPVGRALSFYLTRVLQCPSIQKPTHCLAQASLQLTVSTSQRLFYIKDREQVAHTCYHARPFC